MAEKAWVIGYALSARERRIECSMHAQWFVHSSTLVAHTNQTNEQRSVLAVPDSPLRLILHPPSSILCVVHSPSSIHRRHTAHPPDWPRMGVSEGTSFLLFDAARKPHETREKCEREEQGARRPSPPLVLQASRSYEDVDKGR